MNITGLKRKRQKIVALIKKYKNSRDQFERRKAVKLMHKRDDLSDKIKNKRKLKMRIKK